VHRDRLLLLIVDADRDVSVIQYFVDLKQRLTDLLQQIEIYVTLTEIYWL
jgi:hypothetical protein